MPGTVVVAAVFALLGTAAYVIVGLIFLKAGFTISVRGDKEASFVAALVNLVSAGLMAWGAAAALRGRTKKILFFASLAVVIVDIIEIAAILAISSPKQDFSDEGAIPVFALLFMVCPIIIIILISIQSIGEFLRARRGSTT
ncbi:hypothetical protein [Mycolicibacterium moriokaense]|uniref:hypothetical protein n=1 Tax=Mycolicibacterium moriokaense TaxID=39691 RepID=UPI000D763B07|nr:hypothetical protein [Mycolicibacterium moriokaense]